MSHAEPDSVDSDRASTQATDANGRSPVWLDRALVAYLVVPLAIFIVGMFRLPIALALIALVVLGTLPLMRRYRPAKARFPKVATLVGVGAVSALLAILASDGNLVFLNSDWLKHTAVFHDLSRFDWPIRYVNDAGGDLTFRYYEGFYVVPAVLARVIGSTHLWIPIWEGLGVALVLLKLLSPTRRLRTQALVILTFVFFSGLDIFGYLLRFGTTNLTWVTHIDNWGVANYQSTMVVLFWVPQHGLAAWIATLLILDRDDEDGAFFEGLPVLWTATFFWSSFAAIGLLPFLVVPIVRRIRTAGWRRVVRPEVLAGVVGGVPILLFLTSGAGALPAHWLFSLESTAEILRRLPQTYFFDVFAFVLAVKIAGGRFGWRGLTAMGVLLLLPLYVVGEYGDLAMRASLPALLILFLALRRLLIANPPSLRSWRVAPLVVVILIGAMTGSTEIARAVTKPNTYVEVSPTGPSPMMIFMGADATMLVPQYTAAVPSWLDRLLKQRDPIFHSVAVSASDQPWKAYCQCGPTPIETGNERTTVKAPSGGKTDVASPFRLEAGVYRVRATVESTAPLTSAVITSGSLTAPIDLTSEGDDRYTVDQLMSVGTNDTTLLFQITPSGSTTLTFQNFQVYELRTADDKSAVSLGG